MFIATRNFKHSGIAVKAGDQYSGGDIDFLIYEGLILKVVDQVETTITEPEELTALCEEPAPIKKVRKRKVI
jgi:hypothetical protein